MTRHPNKRRGRPDYTEMAALTGGCFTMGSDRFYPEERPLRRVEVGPFHIDTAPVTNAQFAAFVSATGYVTSAEIAPDVKDYPGLDPALATPGSLVFVTPPDPVGLNDWTQWWSFVAGANWRNPEGPGSSITELADHPVVHVTYDDAKAYARWAGKGLPTEAEWEFAARGGHDGRDFQWGDELAPGGAMLANYWQGEFPTDNTLQDGWLRTSPVRAFPANDFGLFDMIGNVWEWTADWYALPQVRTKPRPDSCCTVVNPRGPLRHESFDPRSPIAGIGRRVTKGGSHLCAENYCQRYRPASRQGQPVDTSTSHIGFRCILRGTAK